MTTGRVESEEMKVTTVKKPPRPTYALLLVSVLLICPTDRAQACHDGSPLILDLDDGGIHTTDTYYPVSFDLDGDGFLDEVAWTDPHTKEGILGIDLDDDGRMTSGLELFGDSTILPDGTAADHGFEALAVWDQADMGGNDDGFITDDDLIWEWLRVWVDENHDGISDRQEVRPLGYHQIVALGLDYQELDEIDPAGNAHRYQGTFVRRVVTRYGPPVLRVQSMHDVFFLYVHDDPDHQGD